ncbi:MAG: YbhB/YbcL family Raf kinase inhibitor-like protein [Candidatus Acidiferrales bacterium]
MKILGRYYISHTVFGCVAAALFCLVSGVAGSAQEGKQKDAGPVLKLSSSSFEADGDIPEKYSCDGTNSSPALAWTDPPAATQSFAVISDDPDVPAKTVVHWVIYDIPGGTRSLPEGVPTKKKLADGSSQGQNTRKKVGYAGPCPEKGAPAHHYFFKLYALDAKTGLKPNAKKEELEAAMKGHILAEAELIGRFKR